MPTPFMRSCYTGEVIKEDWRRHSGDPPKPEEIGQRNKESAVWTRPHEVDVHPDVGDVLDAELSYAVFSLSNRGRFGYDFPRNQKVTIPSFWVVRERLFNTLYPSTGADEWEQVVKVSDQWRLDRFASDAREWLKRTFIERIRDVGINLHDPYIDLRIKDLPVEIQKYIDWEKAKGNDPIAEMMQEILGLSWNNPIMQTTKPTRTPRYLPVVEGETIQADWKHRTIQEFSQWVGEKVRKPEVWTKPCPSFEHPATGETVTRDFLYLDEDGTWRSVLNSPAEMVGLKVLIPEFWTAPKAERKAAEETPHYNARALLEPQARDAYNNQKKQIALRAFEKVARLAWAYGGDSLEVQEYRRRTLKEVKQYIVAPIRQPLSITNRLTSYAQPQAEVLAQMTQERKTEETPMKNEKMITNILVGAATTAAVDTGIQKILVKVAKMAFKSGRSDLAEILIADMTQEVAKFAVPGLALAAVIVLADEAEDQKIKETCQSMIGPLKAATTTGLAGLGKVGLEALIGGPNEEEELRAMIEASKTERRRVEQGQGQTTKSL